MKTFKTFIERKSDRPASERPGRWPDSEFAAVDQAIPRGDPPTRKSKSGKEQKFSVKTLQGIVKDRRNIAKDVKFKDGNIISVPPQAAKALLKLDKKMSKGWDQKVKTAAAFNKVLKIASKL